MYLTRFLDWNYTSFLFVSVGVFHLTLTSNQIPSSLAYIERQKWHRSIQKYYNFIVKQCRFHYV